MPVCSYSRKLASCEWAQESQDGSSSPPSLLWAAQVTLTQKTASQQEILDHHHTEMGRSSVCATNKWCDLWSGVFSSSSLGFSQLLMRLMGSGPCLEVGRIIAVKSFKAGRSQNDLPPLLLDLCSVTGQCYPLCWRFQVLWGGLSWFSWFGASAWQDHRVTLLTPPQRMSPKAAALVFADVIRRVIGACFTIDVGSGPNLTVLNYKSMRVGQREFQCSEGWRVQSPQREILVPGNDLALVEASSHLNFTNCIPSQTACYPK